jgi:thiamine biosynthesis protein ThiS
MAPAEETIGLSINGEARRVPAGLDVAGLLAHLEVRASRVAVERNRQIVPKATYESVKLTDGDEIEIVSFVGGG